MLEMVEHAGLTARQPDSFRLAIGRGQRRVELAAARIAGADAVQRARDSATSEALNHRFDTLAADRPRNERETLVRDLVELSLGSFEIRAGIKVARIQADADAAVLGLGRRIDVVI